MITAVATYAGRVMLCGDEFGDIDPPELTPEEADRVGKLLLRVAEEARRRVSCKNPRRDPDAVVFGVTAHNTTCMCGETIFQDEGETEWTHSRDLGVEVQL